MNNRALIISHIEDIDKELSKLRNYLSPYESRVENIAELLKAKSQALLALVELEALSKHNY